jgi:hypothetical protein
MEQTTSAPAAASCGLSAQAAPLEIKSEALFFVREYIFRVWPDAIRCAAMDLPITPVPIHAIFIGLFPQIRRNNTG